LVRMRTIHSITQRRNPLRSTLGIVAQGPQQTISKPGLHLVSSGRLFLGINDDNLQHNTDQVFDLSINETLLHCEHYCRDSEVFGVRVKPQRARRASNRESPR